MAYHLSRDANVLFSAAYLSDSGLQRLWRLPDATLISPAYAIEEARRNLDTDEQRRRLRGLVATLEVVALIDAEEVRGGDVLPAKDRPILQAAVSASATHLLTGDARHFGRLFGTEAHGVLVLLPGAYLRELEYK